MEYEQIKDEISDSITNIEHQLRLISIRNIKWYNSIRRSRIRESTNYENKVLKSISEFDATIVNEFNFSPFDNVEEIINMIKEDWGTYKPNPYGFINMPSLVSPSIIASQNEEIVNERQLIDNEYINTLKQIEMNKKLISKIQKYPITNNTILTVLISMIILFFLGVIYPLTFTPILGTLELCKIVDIPKRFLEELFSIKGFILFSVSIVFSFIAIFFIYKLNSMRFKKTDYEYIEKYLDVGSYSIFFENMKDA
jgi:hypothetical protein